MCLTVIEGSPPPDTPKQRAVDRIKRMPRAQEMIQCHRCGGREVLVLLLGAVLKNGKVSGGTKQYVCGCCYMKGQRVVLA